MSAVAILGAGPLGGALAKSLAGRNRVARVCLIDQAPGFAAGMALDIRQAAPIDGSGTRLDAQTDPATAAGADVLAVADRAAEPAWTVEAQVLLVRELLRLPGRAPIVLAAPNGTEVIDRLVRETDVAWSRLIGTAPAALAAALKALIAREADVSPGDVALNVLGRPPDRVIVTWQTAVVAGQPLIDLLPPHRMARLGQRLREHWPPGPLALASVAARVIETLLAGGRRRWCCSIAVDGERGPRAVALPVRLGPGGVDRILEPSLTPQERVLVENLRHGA